MNITNKYNLPNGLYKALQKMSYISDDMNSISVSDLINPPLIWYLKKLHKDEIEEDASERLWALLGTAVHYIISEGEDRNLTEERLELEIDGFRIRGRFDVYTEEKEILDYKITSMWSLEKPEWTKQINVYAYMLRRTGFEVEKGFIYAILRDWNKRQAKETIPIPFVVYEIPIWTIEEQEKYIRERIQLFKTIQNSNIEDFICDPEDRWKNNIRCKMYCSVNKFCPFYQREVQNEND
ncbi:PD-(D/E)XK nuclease family protein [Caldisericum sp.]|uniref:PD-(D/E)XK nuclease family protein n=1 Tax=Caldisericum sp. TaxID=2499687 RepID=UPI003D10E855